jgi:hypothetical protein
VTSRWGGLWLRVDGPQADEILAIDTMEDRPLVGTTGWQRHALVLDVAAAAATISFGAGLDERGWAPGHREGANAHGLVAAVRRHRRTARICHDLVWPPPS